MNLVKPKNEGPVETTIVSEDSDPLGQGVFEVKVTNFGIELRPCGSGEWKIIRFSELALFDIQTLMQDCNYILGTYENDVRDKLAELQQRLEDVKRAMAVELRAKGMRKMMQTIK